MFGLTKREQRWKAEQQAAEAILGFVSKIAELRTEVVKTEIENDKTEELNVLREQNKMLSELLEKTSKNQIKEHP